MKKIIWFLLLTLNVQSSFSITSYEVGDTLFNWAKSGLNIRTERTFESKVIETISFGDYLIALERKDENDFDDFKITDSYLIKDTERVNIELQGKWVKIRFKNKIGYVFDSYLSKFEIPEGTDLKEYLSKEFEVVKILDSLFAYGMGKEKIIYYNGAYLKNIIRGSTSEFKLVIPEYSFEEAFQLIYYLNTYLTSILKIKNDSIIIHLECGMYTIKVVEKVVIIIGEFGC